MSNAADEHPTNSTATLIREVQRMGRRGVTWALIYWCYCESLASPSSESEPNKTKQINGASTRSDDLTYPSCCCYATGLSVQMCRSHHQKISCE